MMAYNLTDKYEKLIITIIDLAYEIRDYSQNLASNLTDILSQATIYSLQNTNCSLIAERLLEYFSHIDNYKLLYE